MQGCSSFVSLRVKCEEREGAYLEDFDILLEAPLVKAGTASKHTKQVHDERVCVYTIKESKEGEREGGN